MCKLITQVSQQWKWPQFWFMLLSFTGRRKATLINSPNETWNPVDSIAMFILKILWVSHMLTLWTKYLWPPHNLGFLKFYLIDWFYLYEGLKKEKERAYIQILIIKYSNCWEYVRPASEPVNHCRSPTWLTRTQSLEPTLLVSQGAHYEKLELWSKLGLDLRHIWNVEISSSVLTMKLNVNCTPSQLMWWNLNP